jgi:L-fuculose-phosphate aldolase
MPKIFITDRDIEDLAKQGIMAITLGDDTILTDLAYEKAFRLGVILNRPGPEDPPAAPVRPYVIEPASPASARARGTSLRFNPGTREADLRLAVVEAGQIAYQNGLMISNDGNISVRMADGYILITPSGMCKGRLAPEDLLVIDLDGKIIKPASDPGLKQSSETPMHLEVYRQRPDIRAVIHTHLVFANALVISKGKIRMDVIPEAAIAFGDIPVTDFSMPSSTQNAEAIRSLITSHNVILIRNHGSLTAGKDLDEALIHLERLEHVSKTLTFAELLGDVAPLPSDLLEAIAQIMHQSRIGK